MKRKRDKRVNATMISSHYMTGEMSSVTCPLSTVVVSLPWGVVDG